MAVNGAAAEAPPFKITLRQLPLPVRLVLSLFLLSVGLGYLSALMQLHFRHATSGDALPMPDDMVEIFSGVSNWSGKAPAPPKPVSKMERLIMAPEDLPHNGSGTMAFAFFGKKVTTEEMRQEREGERLAVQAWINTPDDERKKAYENDEFPLPDALASHPLTQVYRDANLNVRVFSLLQDRCSKCHLSADAQGKRQLVDYADFADVLTVPTVGKTSRQMSLDALVQTTHLHLLSFCMLWTLTGLIFAFSSYPKWIRCILAPLVLLAQVADVSCWWLARQTDPCLFLYQYLLPHGVGPYFALAIMGTGAVVGLGLGLQIVLSLFNMYRLPGKVVLLLLFIGTAVVGGVYLKPQVETYLIREKAAAPATAPADKSAHFPSFPSFPNSVWERQSAKLRFASGPPRDAKRSFADTRAQTEFGHEGVPLLRSVANRCALTSD